MPTGAGADRPRWSLAARTGLLCRPTEPTGSVSGAADRADHAHHLLSPGPYALDAGPHRACARRATTRSGSRRAQATPGCRPRRALGAGDGPGEASVTDSGPQARLRAAGSYVLPPPAATGGDGARPRDPSARHER